MDEPFSEDYAEHVDQPKDESDSGSIVGYPTFEAVLENDATVAALYQSWTREGGSREQFLERCVCVLARQKHEIADKALELSLLAPKRYRMPDGSEVVYRTPTKLVPVSSVPSGG